MTKISLKKGTNSKQPFLPDNVESSMTAASQCAKAAPATARTARKKSAPPTWDALKLEYINSSVSLEDLAGRHGISFDALRKQAERGQWINDRRTQSHSVAAAAQQKITERHINELVRFNEEDLRIARALREQIRQVVEAAGKTDAPPLSATALRHLAAAAESVQRIGRLALGATTDNMGHSAPDGGPVKTVTFLATAEDIDRARQLRQKLLSDFSQQGQ